jgi:uncharacterized damage-inducible protein DinB
MNTKTVQPLIAQLELQTALFLSALENISDAETNQYVNESLNSIKWIAGHLVNTRMTLLLILTGKGEDPVYAKLFGKGTSGNRNQTYPDIEEVKRKWEYITTEIIESMQQATDDLLLGSPPFQTSIPDKTLLGLIAFFILHESNHLGQMSILRKITVRPVLSELSFYDKVICN